MSGCDAPAGLLALESIRTPRDLPPIEVKRTRYFWTAREVKVLKETYPKHGLGACIPLLPGRSPGAIYQQAALQGLKSPTTTGPRHVWTTTPFIDDAIRRTYQGNPTKGAVNELARRLGRPRHWVSQRARQLSLIVPRFKEPPWSPAENRILEENAHRSLSTIQRRLRAAGYTRTETAILTRRKRLHLSAQDPNAHSAYELAGLFGVDGKTVTGWIAKGWLKAKRRGRRARKSRAATNGSSSAATCSGSWSITRRRSICAKWTASGSSS